MRASEVVDLIRHRVNDPEAKYHKSQDIYSWLNVLQRSLFRRKVEADTSYGRETLDIYGDDDTRVMQVQSDTWRFFLPSWVYRVRGVNWLDDDQPTGRLGASVPLSNWTFSGNRTLDVRCGSSVRDIRVFTAKVPAMIRPLTIVAQSEATNEIYIPVDDDNGYRVEREDGCMLGASLEIVDVVDINRDCRGQVVVVVGQERDVIDEKPAWKLTVMPPFSEVPFVGDAIDMHTDIEDVHVEYLIDMVCEALFQRQQNLSALATLTRKLAICEQRFVMGIQPRTDGINKFMNDSETSGNAYDPDRDPFFDGGE